MTIAQGVKLLKSNPAAVLIRAGGDKNLLHKMEGFVGSLLDCFVVGAGMAGTGNYGDKKPLKHEISDERRIKQILINLC